jgi:hypothetical protein
MKILKQTATQLVTQHQQTGERLVIGCCVLMSAGSILIASIVPEISCRREGTLSQCKLIRHMLGNWQLEQPIALQGVRNEPVCSFSRVKKGGNCNGSVAIVQTQIGEIQLLENSYTEGASTAEIKKFLKNSNQTSLQIRSAGWSLNHPISNGFLVMFAMVMLASARQRLIEQRTYTCDFDKARDWVSIFLR